jgi:hypothetical protein
VPGADLAIGTELERFMAKRMHATTIEVPGASHVVMISHPQETTRLILDAAGDGRGDDDHEGRAARSHPRSRQGIHRPPRRTAR